VARTAVSGRLSWLVATVKEARDETATARTLSLDVPGWPGHLAGQHVTAKLTAEDGYAAQRDYSIASAPEPDRFEVTVQRLADGEVSPYLTGVAAPGDQLEVRGPIGGWFAWQPADPRPLLLLAGGSGIVPLMSMIRTRDQAGSQVPVRLVYSARTPADVIYQPELSERVRVSPLTVSYLYTRTVQDPATRTFHGPYTRTEQDPAPAPQADATAGHGGGRILRRYGDRLDAGALAEVAFSPRQHPAIFVCGPSGFVEAASDLLVAAGHLPGAIKTERFGPTS
jgi:ferredoxin-NADP reductase